MKCLFGPCKNQFSDLDAENGRRFCSAYCSGRNRRITKNLSRAYHVGKPDCLTPYKIAHDSLVTAKNHFDALQLMKHDPDLCIYTCDCGKLHVGHDTPGKSIAHYNAWSARRKPGC